MTLRFGCLGREEKVEGEGLTARFSLLGERACEANSRRHKETRRNKNNENNFEDEQKCRL